MTLNQISVFVENKSGALATITDVLSKGGVNLRALSIAETKDFGVLRFIADDDEKAVSVLKAADYVLTVTPVLGVVLQDKPGSFAATLAILAKEGIDVEYTYAFLTPRTGTACMIFRVEDNEKTAKILTDAGVTLAKKSEML